MKYLYVERTRIGWRVTRDCEGTCSREGLHYVGYTRRQAIRAFRQDFNCVGKHFITIDY